ncbi:unnamed protein product [Blepharisma stoltei]|uniref:C2H2-type domain-containing protein n=1 Tax=Blepharisma stoltei TaxID=1481888 RepID=A0AAU9IU93_9CILI|nr:unnamed protein product [Blepharisma stoltei]
MSSLWCFCDGKIEIKETVIDVQGDGLRQNSQDLLMEETDYYFVRQPIIVSPKKIYACIFCSLNFNNPIDLEKHNLRHTPNRQFCPICDEHHEGNQEMQLHMEQHESCGN